MNSNPYDFFDNEEEEVVQTLDNSHMSGGVISTSMFD
jgi:hypothetical protein